MPLPRRMQDAGQNLAVGIICMWEAYLVGTSAYVVRQLDSGAAVPPQQRQQLWQAHSTGCRLVHWAAAGASR